MKPLSFSPQISLDKELKQCYIYYTKLGKNIRDPLLKAKEPRDLTG